MDAERSPGRARRPSRVRRWWIFARSLPATAARLARQLATRRSARTLVLWFDGDGAELAAALKRIEDPPERVLVVTNRLDFAPLLAAGVGFEHVPPGDEEFVRGRLDLILAERPRPRRTITVGQAPPGGSVASS